MASAISFGVVWIATGMPTSSIASITAPYIVATLTGSRSIVRRSPVDVVRSSRCPMKSNDHSKASVPYGTREMRSPVGDGYSVTLQE